MPRRRFPVREWSHANVDKSSWGDGAWQNEPDKIQWVDHATGLDCLMHRNQHGAWCGYVGVPNTHPLYGKPPGELPELPSHFAVNYAAGCDDTDVDGHDEGFGVCHVPFDGRPADVWWLGFDCSHFSDYSPWLEQRMGELEKQFGRIFPSLGEHDEQGQRYKKYRDRAYVVAVVRRLARRLFELRRAP